MTFRPAVNLGKGCGRDFGVPPGPAEIMDVVGMEVVGIYQDGSCTLR